MIRIHGEKVVFFLGCPNPFPGAGWTRIGFFAEHLTRKSYEVYVTGVFSLKSLKQAGTTSWRKVQILNICPTVSFQNVFSIFFNILSSLITLPLLFLQLRPRYVIISVPSGDPIIGAYVAARLVKAKVVIDYRDEWEDARISSSKALFYRGVSRLQKTFLSKLYMKSDLVVSVTEPTARALASRGVQNVELVPNGADTNVFKRYDKEKARQELGVSENDFVMAYCGGMGGYYKLDVVVKAMAELSTDLRERTKLLLIGGGPDLPIITTLAHDLGLQENVLYVGVKKDKEELARIISASDVAIVPYDANPLWKHALPAKFYEYCACGIPVIATVYEDSILAALIRTYGVGLSVRPMDKLELKKAIQWMYEATSFRVKASERALRFIESYFDRNKIAKQFHQLLESLYQEHEASLSMGALDMLEHQTFDR